MANKGYVCISRSVLSLPVWRKPYTCTLLFYCLLKATHSNYGSLLPGQFAQSLQDIANELHWAKCTVHSYLHELEKDGFIRLSIYGDLTLITITGWKAVFDGESSEAFCKTDRVVCETERSVCETERTGMRDRTRITIQEQEQENNTESPRAREFESWWREYPKHCRKSEAWRAWLKLGIPADKLTQALRNAKQSADWIKENGRFIPAAVNFLDGAWEDYLNDEKMEGSKVWTEY